MDRPGQWDAATLDDVLDVLHDIVLWELTASRWAQVELLLTRVAATFAAGDDEELRVVVADLKEIGPTRALRRGSTTITGIPETILDLRYALVHLLSHQQPQAGRGARPAR